MDWAGWAAAKIAEAQSQGRRRQLRPLDLRGPRGKLADGTPVTVFASNDYLGLSAHAAVVSAAQQAIERWGTGAGAARLISGHRPVHAELEAALAEWKGTEAALVFPTGYATNLGVLSALAGPQVLICSDSLNHASIIDGCRLARSMGAAVEVYPHLDVGRLAALLAGWDGLKVVVTDALFSMDGDAAPIGQLGELCARHGALLILDEAHAVLGPHARDRPCELLHVGTMSKTLGSQGGFVAGPRTFVEMLINQSRPFIFTTGLAPASAAAALAALKVIRSTEGEELLSRLATYSGHFTRRGPVPSPIVPIIVGSEEAAMDASAALLADGLLVPAIRPPTVPPGTSRLRIALSAAHSEAEVLGLEKALRRLGLPLPAG